MAIYRRTYDQCVNRKCKHFWEEQNIDDVMLGTPQPLTPTSGVQGPFDPLPGPPDLCAYGEPMMRNSRLVDLDFL